MWYYRTGFPPCMKVLETTNQTGISITKPHIMSEITPRNSPSLYCVPLIFTALYFQSTVNVDRFHQQIVIFHPVIRLQQCEKTQTPFLLTHLTGSVPSALTEAVSWNKRPIDVFSTHKRCWHMQSWHLKRRRWIKLICPSLERVFCKYLISSVEYKRFTKDLSSMNNKQRDFLLNKI